MHFPAAFSFQKFSGGAGTRTLLEMMGFIISLSYGSSGPTIIYFSKNSSYLKPLRKPWVPGCFGPVPGFTDITVLLSLRSNISKPLILLHNLDKHQPSDDAFQESKKLSKNEAGEDLYYACLASFDTCCDISQGHM